MIIQNFVVLYFLYSLFNVIIYFAWEIIYNTITNWYVKREREKEAGYFNFIIYLFLYYNRLILYLNEKDVTKLWK